MRDHSAHYMLSSDKTVLRVSMETAHRWLEKNREEKIVKQEDVGGFWVSTVFLLIDHGYSDDGPPILFETMVFQSGADLTDLHCERCATYAEAVAQHARVCDGVRAGTIPETE